jgi:hypothetical protein
MAATASTTPPIPGSWATIRPTAPRRSNKADIKQQTLTANLGYRLGDGAVFDVTSSYTKVTGEETACYAGGPPWIIGGAHDCYQYYQFAPFHQFSTEARLHSAPGAELLWNLGVYHFDYTASDL